MSFQEYMTFLEELAAQGGPKPEQDKILSDTLDRLYQDLQLGNISTNELSKIRSKMNFTPETMQGFVYLKPNGYAGCFETIDRIYQCYHAQNPNLYNWDRYWHNHPAAQAVRNRKDYFLNLVNSEIEKRGNLTILNLASGPCRDIFELFEEISSDLPVTIHCVEQDRRAISYAKNLCKAHLHKMVFYHANVLRFLPKEKFDLVWSAGLFDYLNNRIFVKMLAKLANKVKSRGELIIGNFSPINPSHAYMNLVDWLLIYRSSEDLCRLALDAGFSSDRIEVKSEPLLINFFLHIKL